jgi:TatD DNase family protein
VSGEGLRWLDSHCHVTAPEFDADRGAVLDRAEAAGVDTLLAIGSGWGLEACERAVELAAHDSRVFATAGVHPHDASLWDDAARARTAAWLARPRVVAVGECGLDYWYERSPRDAQRRAFAEQLALARARRLPVSIHVRGRDAAAYDDLLAIWRAETGGALEGVLHCYTHTEAFARQALDAGLLVSFSGILTFERDGGLREVARALPLDRLLVETDAPLLAPKGHRGRRNEPAWVVEVGRVLAAARGLPVEAVAAATRANACRLLRLPA